MSPTKEVESDYRASIEIRENAKRKGWGVHEHEFELPPRSSFGHPGRLTIFILEKDLRIKEVAGVIHREGKRDVAFGPSELLKKLR